jgi:1,4-alpha-glucan branching enzyme
MLYLDYSREDGEWIPNQFGGNENLEAIEFLRRFNTAVFDRFPDVQTFAEESTAWPMVSRPVYVGGLGFGFKWDMGWMHDTLEVFELEPIYRKYHHDQLTFRAVYGYAENYTCRCPTTRSCTARAR